MSTYFIAETAGKTMPAITGVRMSGRGRMVARLTLVVALAGVMAACQTARFGGQPQQREVVRDLEPGPSAPSGIVMAEPLGAPGSGRIDDFPELEPRTASAGDRQQTAALSEPAPQPTRLSRTSLVGSWNASEPGGGSCRVTLSSTPALDLYRASASGCSNQEVASVNAWDLRGSEVYLYKQGGAVAARLQASRGSMSGAISQSGAPLTMSR
ncbi:MAG: AprI/Inh family metalloprotease inhibitor [Salinarimonas sp.]